MKQYNPSSFYQTAKNTLGNLARYTARLYIAAHLALSPMSSAYSEEAPSTAKTKPDTSWHIKWFKKYLEEHGIEGKITKEQVKNNAIQQAIEYLEPLKEKQQKKYGERTYNKFKMLIIKEVFLQNYLEKFNRRDINGDGVLNKDDDQNLDDNLDNFDKEIFEWQEDIKNNPDQ